MSAVTKVTLELVEANRRCFLEDEPFKMCCCNCAFQHEVHKHCAHSPGGGGGNCVCSESLGIFVCSPPEMGRTSISSKHSCGCELYTAKDSEARI